MDWLVAAGLLFAGFIVGASAAYMWKGKPVEQPRIQRANLPMACAPARGHSRGLGLRRMDFIRLEEGASEFIQGIVLTALAGAISSILSFVGLIVKGLLDELRDSENDGPTNRLSKGKQQ